MLSKVPFFELLNSPILGKKFKFCVQLEEQFFRIGPSSNDTIVFNVVSHLFRFQYMKRMTDVASK